MYGGSILKQYAIDIWHDGKTIEEIVNTLGKDKTTPKDVSEVIHTYYSEDNKIRSKILRNAVLFLAKHHGATLEEVNTLRELLKKYIYNEEAKNG